MSKNQQKQVTNAANTQLSSTRDQGASNNQQLQSVFGDYQSNAKNLFPGLAGGFNDIASTGGFNPAQLDKIQSGYTNLALTGGYTPEDMAYMRNAAADSARSAYSTGRDELQRNIAATGGYGFGTAAINSLARKGSEAATDATGKVNADIARNKIQNQYQGLQGLQGLEQAQVGNRLSGLAGGSNLYNTNVAATQNTLEDIIKNFQVTGSLSADDLKTLAGLANSTKNWWENVQGVAGPVGGMLQGIGAAFA